MATEKTISEYLAESRAADQARYGELLRRGGKLLAQEYAELAGLVSRLGVLPEEVDKDLAAVEAAKGLGLLRQKLSELTSARRAATAAREEHDAKRVAFLEEWGLQDKELAAKIYAGDPAIVAVEAEIAVAEKAVAAGADALGLGGLLERPELEHVPGPDTLKVWLSPPLVEETQYVEIHRVQVDDLEVGSVASFDAGEESGVGRVVEMTAAAVRVIDSHKVRRFIRRELIRYVWKLPAAETGEAAEAAETAEPAVGVDLRE
jgi:hypothetical protein